MTTRRAQFEITRTDGTQRIHCWCGTSALARTDIDAARFKRQHATCQPPRPPRGAAA